MLPICCQVLKSLPKPLKIVDFIMATIWLQGKHKVICRVNMYRVGSFYLPNK